MKQLHLTLLLLLSLVTPSFADTIEFREFTLKPAEGQKPLTDDQIRDAIINNQLGKDKSVTIPVKDEKFQHNDTKPIDYASEYNEDMTIAKVVSKEMGIVISGTTQTVDNHIRVDFKYQTTTKVEDIIYGTKDNSSILMPVFNNWLIHSTLLVDTKNNQWMITALPSNNPSKTYVAFKITVK